MLLLPAMSSALVGCLLLLPSQRQQVAGTVRPPPQPLPSNGTEPCHAINHAYKLHSRVKPFQSAITPIHITPHHTHHNHEPNVRVQMRFFSWTPQSSLVICPTTGTESMTSPFFRVMVPVFRSLGTRRPFWPSPSLRQCPCPNVLPRARAFCFMPCRPNQKSITCGVARPRSCSPHCVKTEKTVLLTIINVPSLVHRPPTGPHSLGGPPGDC